MKKRVLFSIICPIYNGEKTIEKLINSIVCQKFKNYELILINDGSSDNTINVIKKYTKKFSNIYIYEKSNSGVGDTRNFGLSRANGKYIMFADCDDYYSQDFFNILLKEINDDFDLLVYNAMVVNEDCLSGPFISENIKNYKIKETNGIKKYLQGEYCHKLGAVPWNKVYKHKIIKQNCIQFNVDKKSGEDLLFNMEYLAKVKTIKYIDNMLYYYNSCPNVFKKQKYVKNEIEENIMYYNFFVKLCSENNIKNYEYLISLFYLRRLPGIILNETNNMSFSAGFNNLKNYFLNNQIKSSLKYINFKFFDFKILISYIIYLTKLYYFVFILYYFLKKLFSFKFITK